MHVAMIGGPLSVFPMYTHVLPWWLPTASGIFIYMYI